AEDGIRDFHVTGVQTCALPILGYINGDSALFEQIDSVEGVYNRIVVYRRNVLHSGNIDSTRVPPADVHAGRLSINSFIDILEPRSEERRVGKECRARWSRDAYK